MRADGSLEIRFLRVSRPEEIQRPDRAGGARRVRRRGLRAAQGPLRLPAHRPRAAKKRHRREREARAPHHAEARACRKGRGPKAPHSEEGRAGRPSVEPGRARFHRGRAKQALGGRIACMPAREGWLYLAAATGTFSRKVAGRSMSGRITGKVAIDAIGRAVGGEGPPDDGKPRLPWRPRRAARLPLLPAMPGLAWRSPVGIEARHAAGQRGGRVVPRDAEKGIGGRVELRDEAKQDIFKFIELYCNRARMHSTLDCMSPVEYERQYA